MLERRAATLSRPGDLWRCGPHRVLCGDSTRRDDVTRLLGGARPHLMVSDPPYGVSYDPTWRDRRDARRGGGRRRGDRRDAPSGRRTGRVLNDHRADWRDAWALFPGGIAYVWHGALHACTVAEGLVGAGFGIRAQIIWAKERLVFGRGHYHWQHEPCWYAVRRSGTAHWSGDRKQTTLWQITNRNQDMATPHPTQKPIECMRRPMLNNATLGDLVYDPFLGSGTSLIAAETAGRICVGLELDPANVDVILGRWTSFAGEPPVELTTGMRPETLRAARKAEASDG